MILEGNDREDPSTPEQTKLHDINENNKLEK